MKNDEIIETLRMALEHVQANHQATIALREQFGALLQEWQKMQKQMLNIKVN
ncbi:hypothetical protein [Burkholderia cepacia]|uniref:hypothetical protein n=1 Tax=Burkholderia cepacia TaxID=292 RepID=UPI001F353BE4|nr:hypothetical protein [Burkholderia cepacia]MCE4126119.1 hypothetical protein [Burkholderia cepacia]